jgi:pimeloyl-ACP methyl ester carboxylesterase
VLVHGFASNAFVNWVQPGWVSALTRDGRRVIALDNRGHGQSTKLYDPARLSHRPDGRRRGGADRPSRARTRRRDGPSLGARITAVLAARHPDRVRSVILGGVGNQARGGRGPAP